jgi:hypothetical protein
VLFSPALTNARGCTRVAEKDQEQVVELPRFRFRNAAKSSEQRADRSFRPLASPP